MLRIFSRPALLLLVLALCTLIPVMMALVRVIQIPTGTYEADSLRLAVAPLPWFLHALAAGIFGLAGPLNLVLALRRRFGRLHRMAGWAFVCAGTILALSGLLLLAMVEMQSTPLIDIVRGIFSAALLLALASAILAIRVGDIHAHRAWAVRAYAIGMGAGTISMLYLPIYIVTGTLPNGLTSDVIYAAWWVLNIGFAEWVIHRITPAIRRVPA
ncbi:MAG: DUF2306 domain-containing protein [Tabrizicola sp.]|jgi:uncharacterized membrane protein|nr:DUF2306 domain-containing protein [Tabrizicola sp.]